MMIMAIDHASALIARQHASEFWAGAMSAYSSAFPFLTRWITHLCAPGFFFLMGAGIYWSAAGREGGWSEAAATRHAVGRGFAILVTGLLLESPILYLQNLLKPAAVSLNRISAPPPNDGSALYLGLITLSGLGLVMIICGLLLRLRPWAWLLVSAALRVRHQFAASRLWKAGPVVGGFTSYARPFTALARHLSGDPLAGRRCGWSVLWPLVGAPILRGRAGESGSSGRLFC